MRTAVAALLTSLLLGVAGPVDGPTSRAPDVEREQRVDDVVAGPTSGARDVEWKQRIDEVVAGNRVGVAVGDDGTLLYSRGARFKRIPASNQKLLLSMALLDRLGPETRLSTNAVIRRGTFADGVVSGNLWLIGRGDPTLSTGSYGKGWSFKPTRLGHLARGIKSAGITRVRGRVVGAVSYFAHDWWATGWKSYFPAYYVGLPSALAINGNVAGGRYIADPEKRAARLLTRKLRGLGVRVDGDPAAGPAPANRERVAVVRSAELSSLMTYMNHRSSNFFAEMLGKQLGVARAGPLGTIAKGARAIRSYAAEGHVGVESHDSSGLSYSNRVSAKGIYHLLSAAENSPLGDELRRSLPRAGSGTLKDRLENVRVRAKTGTLKEVSALSGWVWLERADTWAEFSILSRGMSKAKAVRIENKIVRIVANHAG